MTWIANQTPEELRAFLRKREKEWIGSMTDPLAQRLWKEVQVLDARIVELEKQLAARTPAKAVA
ncbi:hypothetical protein [Paraburkholderia sp. SOS3]|uniref:hypothetical protein n=1 Tax=Paraburkholderia sp. SOS3 TaxID=1926494 RepID=UPI0009474E34|nr:hypothetical protein [Paraburkholderia sp. SOS3]APR40008.1 hypothetical protein BTO02_33235 [Paraburkholderia sp. SOS3]